jgi:hypothetical protein
MGKVFNLYALIHHNCNDPWYEAPPWAIELREMLSLILKTEQHMESEMTLDFTKMVAAAEKQRGVTNSVLQYLSDQSKTLADIRTQLATAIAANDPVAMKAAQDQLDAFAAGVDDNDDKIAAAIAAPGTVGTPPPPNAP